MTIRKQMQKDTLHSQHFVCLFEAILCFRLYMFEHCFAITSVFLCGFLYCNHRKTGKSAGFHYKYKYYK